MAKKMKHPQSDGKRPDSEMSEMIGNVFILKCLVLDNGSCPIVNWIRGIKDMTTRQRIQSRLDRIERGNMGDCRSLGDGLLELKLDFGPGYRIYFAKVKKKLVVLLIGGHKSTQENDISTAKQIWKDNKDETQRYERDLPR